MNKKRIMLLVLGPAAAVALACLPLLTENESTINLMILILLYVTLASSWNVLGGYTGQSNLGHAAFYGIGSLATRLLWTSGWPILPSMLAGAAVAVALALLIGAPAFKLRGVYFAIGTLALAQILNVTVGNVLPTISLLPVSNLVSYELVPRYYLFLAVALLTIVTAYVLVNSRLGLGMMTVREEEEAAESLGISAFRHKLLALCVSAFFAGLAGGAFAYYHVGYYLQFPFSPVWTFDAMMMAYIGGTSTIVGPIIGAIFFVVVKELLVLNLGEYHLTVFGVLFILVVLFLPGGFVEAWEKLQALALRSKPKELEVVPTSDAKGGCV